MGQVAVRLAKEVESGVVEAEVEVEAKMVEALEAVEAEAGMIAALEAVEAVQFQSLLRNYHKT